MYALVDGNNFYVSCERVFRPSLIILENSDPPAAIEDDAYIEMFTGLDDDGRYGLLDRISPRL